MAQQLVQRYDADENLSKFLNKELGKSIKFQKKHEKELNNLLAYQQLIKDEKLKNENKLHQMFYKEKLIDHQKKQKDDFLKEQKVNKDHQFLYKQKENDYINSLDASWCFYQDYSPSKDMKPLKVDAEREKVLRFLFKQLQTTTDNVERALIKKKINKFRDSEISKKKLDYIDHKIEYAKQVRSESLDRSIDKIRMHDMHIIDVQEKNNLINQEKQSYYNDKINQIEQKIQMIEKQQQRNKLNRLNIEQQKDEYRQAVRSNSQTLIHQKELINQNHFSEKIYKLNFLVDQKQKLLKQRQELLDALNQKRLIARQSLDDVKYPQINSNNYKAVNY
ncbi:unnamed protein product [Paramecium primaurelia]|uniref:Uncharacterized protein n=1 Tax=Paramecium primaurelia TaxID=5886 RepID=A0A8S1LJ56_PARPR|nr:unnamed protein product [Paramecium primaurelia]